MKITLLVTSFNSLSQLTYTYLKDKDYFVDIVYSNSNTKMEEINTFKPDIILCPFLKDFISKEIYEVYPTFIFHPGIKGDRGAYSLENSLSLKNWGVVILKANDIYDGGDIYTNYDFKIRQTTKASIYRNEVNNSFYATLDDLFINFKDAIYTKQILNPLNNKPNLQINWQKDTSQEIVNKINILDSFPGILDEILGMKYFLFGAWIEEKLNSDKPKKIIAKRDGAICLGTIDGAIWISHLKEIDKFKLPATYVLKNKLKGIKEHRLPLIFDKSYKTFYEISCDIKNDIAYLYFNFHNGAFRAEQCMRLKYAIEYIKTQVKVLVLMGGDDFFSNGINLNILEDSKKNGEDGWSNINAINDLLKSIIFASEVITVASVSKNAGAGGVFLATACDKVISSNTTIFNPHYKSLGLSGSEYHIYSLYKRVNKDIASKLLDNCLPISALKAKKINLVDEVFGIKTYNSDLENYCQNLIHNEDEFDNILWNKEDYLEENQSQIEQYRKNEITIMYDEFWNKDSVFHKLRYEFVHKICQTSTPKRLKYKENKNA